MFNQSKFPIFAEEKYLREPLAREKWDRTFPRTLEAASKSER